MGGECCVRYTYLVICILVSIAYFVDVIYGYINCEKSYKWAIFVTIPFYLLFAALFTWCWYVTCISDPGSLLNFYKERGILQQILDGNIPEPLQNLPLCQKCHLPKPLRCHHCSECKRCHFRFDHHCPFIGNCVALYNIKAFILLPFHGGLAIAVFGAEVAIAHYIIFGIMLVILGLCIALTGFVWLPSICSNETTLEDIGHMRVRGENYNVWCCANFRQICAFPDYCLPTRPPVDGFYWTTKEVEDYVQSLPITTTV